MKIILQPSVLQWARERAKLSVEDLAAKFGKKDVASWTKKVEGWENDGTLTYREAEKLAKATHTAFGYLFLDRPPEVRMPIPDFRTAGGQGLEGMSTELLDVIYQSLRRQEWFRDYLQEMESEKLPFASSVSKSLAQ